MYIHNCCTQHTCAHRQILRAGTKQFVCSFVHWVSVRSVNTIQTQSVHLCILKTTKHCWSSVLLMEWEGNLNLLVHNRFRKTFNFKLAKTHKHPGSFLNHKTCTRRWQGIQIPLMRFQIIWTEQTILTKISEKSVVRWSWCFKSCIFTVIRLAGFWINVKVDTQLIVWYVWAISLQRDCDVDDTPFLFMRRYRSWAMPDFSTTYFDGDLTCRIFQSS